MNYDLWIMAVGWGGEGGVEPRPYVHPSFFNSFIFEESKFPRPIILPAAPSGSAVFDVIGRMLFELCFEA